MAKKITDFLKSNAGGAAIGAAFSISDLASLAKGENVLKSIKNIIMNIVLANGAMYYAFGKTFSGLGNMVKGLIVSTGSLNTAMKKLGAAESAQKSFTALGVSAAGAKAEIAKLAKMSSANGLRFEEVSEATQSLIALSRGAMGTADDMERLIDVSKATGASLQGLAENAGAVSEAMRNGSEIDGAIDRLRTMGAISDSAASSLKNLQKAGAGAFSIQAGLDAAMGKKSAGRKDGLAEVEQQQEAAGKGAQAAAGKPWIEGDIKSTKNYTEALKAMTPIIAQVSSFFASMFAYIGSWTSGLVKWVTSFSLVRGGLAALVYGVTAFAAVLTMVMGTKFIGWMMSSGSAFGWLSTHVKAAGVGLVRFTGSATVARVAVMGMNAALAVTKWALIAVQAASLFLMGFAVIGALVSSLAGNTAELAKELDEAARASKDFNDELMLQANNIETLADKHALLQKALKASADAWDAVREQRELNDSKWFGASDEDKQKLARKTADAEAIDKSNSKIIAAPVSEIAVKRHEAAKKLSEAQTARELASSRATPEQRAEMDKVESERLAGLAAQGEAEIAQGRQTELDASPIEIRRGKALAKHNTARNKHKRKHATEKSAEELEKLLDKEYVDKAVKIRRGEWDSQAQADSEARIKAARDKHQTVRDAENAGPDQTKFDAEIAVLYANSASLEKQGMGEQQLVALERAANPNASTPQRDAWTKRHDDAQIKIDKGKKLAGESLQNQAEAEAKAEESRKGEIAGKYANLEADAQAALASNMSEGHQAFMHQSNAKLASIDREIEAYKELHKGVDATNDAYLKSRANAKAAELVAQKFEAQKHEADQRQLVAREKAAADESVGMTRQANERAAAVNEALDAYEQEREIQEELKAQDEDNTGTVGYKNQANDTKLRGLFANFNEAYIARKEGDKQDKLTVDSMNRDIASNQAAADGDSETVKMNEAADNLQAKAMEFRSKGMTDKEAAVAAQRYVRNSVEIQAGQDSRSAAQSAAVSSLAAIGAGGGVESVDTQIDLTKRLVDLNKRANELLTIISGQQPDIPIQ